MRREHMQDFDVLLPCSPDEAPTWSPAKDSSLERLEAPMDASGRAGKPASPM